ncbi:M20 metallopeptidase family protein [Brumimicrobium aurantiacum]|uniref:Amidohydrolase n=1 Tax=Brumimicrobium aurantiacum TaxID=1737063 RepID=A0A3E1EXT1_9FLAO|nr:M20 family metallopeptidase [Brumimicrobium aurantiacum]RFC54370.1 amidohydrolase [Brumimicrobium aurantiacum]
MDKSIKNQVIAKSEELFEKVVAYRKHLHKNPELSYQEFETMKFISEQLTKIGIPHETGIADTGIMAMIKGDHHTKEQSCIGLRADIDALPIQEQNDVEYASQNEGVMHACGHDVHTSVLLGAAEILFSMRNELKDPVKLIFQPGEEKNPGGASLMIQAGCLQNPTVKEMYALHVFPDFNVGQVGTKEGLYMASCDEVYIDITGKSGHGATPHETIDSILVGAEIVTSLQQIVSRKCDPKIPCALNFGHFEAIGTTNVVPEKVHIKGTFRTMNEEWRAKALEQIIHQSERIAEAHGAKAEVNISKGYPFLENDIDLTRNFVSKANDWLGEENVHDLPIRLTAEDFSFYAQEIPTCFFRIGVRNEERGIIHGVHNSKFDIDHEALKTGMQMMVMSCL